MDIRQYRDCDLDELLTVWESASKIGHPFLPKEFLKTERRNIPEKYLPSGETWVAVKDESVVGFTILHGNEVGALFVNPMFQSLGIGQALLNNVLGAHSVLGTHSVLEVEVFKKNGVGRKFYSNYGFELVREYYHEESGFDMMRLQFSSAK